MKYSFDESDLTSEKSLWDVYKLSRRIHPKKSQVIILLIVMATLAANAFILENKSESILTDVRKWAELGFNFGITTLGFLIAGFTIFATLSKPKMLLAMMEHTNKETGLPTLKYNFFAFMKVFIAYITFTLFYLVILLFGQANGLISNIGGLLPYSECLGIALIKITYVLIGGSFVHLLLLLKTFIFNIYAIVMNFLRWEYHQD
ncbi:hypothetical protein J8L84_15080 [Alteromonas sp. MMG017]|uniref:hypothetical protein n=1 Tax=Alteromonas sp. MMG017 TaxID=2822692 RepID=UPI001B39FD2C|nr:hypothetical protein [Alteromonas sp. MMG017]MBQ4830599.1 hypothetical protein [Alteromonas sp. MMG017]